MLVWNNYTLNVGIEQFDTKCWYRTIRH